MAPTKDSATAPSAVDDKSKKDLKAADSTLKDQKNKDKDKKKDDGKDEELSEEDEKLKSELEMLVERLKEPDASLYEPALEALKSFIRTSTSSMTAVPKPLKFLRPFYPDMTQLYEQWTSSAEENEGEGSTKPRQPTELNNKLADILSVLGMTYSGDGKRESLKYRLLSNIDDDIGSWGHEYVRHLALEIGEEYAERSEKEESVDDIVGLSLKIVPFFLHHNAEADAVDLLLEVESTEKLPEFIDKDTFARVCLYMVSCVPLLAPPDDSAFLHTAYNIYLTHGQLTQALALAIRIDDEDLIRSVFDATEDKLVLQQLAFILARQQCWIYFDDEDVQKCLSNGMLSEHFEYLAKELNLEEPKVPEDIYKSHLEHGGSGAGSGIPDSAKQNLAAAFVNAFVNCGYGKDKLLITPDESNSWIYKTKGPGMASTTAAIGSIFQWDFANGLQELDKYMYSYDEQIKAGSLLGIGIVNAGVHDESDPAFALLSDFVNNSNVSLRTNAVMGLGLSYSGSRRTDLSDLLLPLVYDADLSMQISSLAALSLGHIFVGSANGEITSAILQTLLERDHSQLSDKWARFMALGLALLYMGKYDETENVLETLKVIEHPIAQDIEILLTICSYSGTGNVLQIQKLLQECTSGSLKKDDDEEDDFTDTAKAAAAEGEGEGETDNTETDNAGAAAAAVDSSATEKSEPSSTAPPHDSIYQGYSVLGIAAIAMGEEIGQDMVLRHFGHLMHYGDAQIRRAIPLAMGLVSASNPQMKVFDTLSRYSHDSDLDVAVNAIFAMGIVGAGTNNARLAQLLRQLAMYYSRDPDSLFMVRIAQGLLHLGKGTITLNPFNNDRQILSQVSLAGLLTVSVALLDPRSFILSSSHSMLYFLTTSFRPRMLITLDKDLQPIKVNVRVGQAVETVGQAGRPKTITGWVTHSTPVLLGYGERAELEDDEYVALASTLEGVVILKKNTERMEIDH